MKIAVLTCDLYAQDVMPIWAMAFRYRWPDCPWPVEEVGETVPSLEFPWRGMGPGGHPVEERRLAVRDRLLRYLDEDPGEALMFFLDDWVLYSHHVRTWEVERAYETIMADDGVGGVVFCGERQPERFYDGFLGEYEEAEDLIFFRPGIWKPWALNRLREGIMPRVLGTYYSPLVHIDLMGGGKVRLSGVKALMEQRSVVIPMLEALCRKFGRA